MRYRTSHKTTYHYEAPVTQCVSEAHLVPRSCARQTVDSATVKVEPAPVTQELRQDYFGNHVNVFSILEKHESLAVTADCVVDVDGGRTDPLPKTTWEAVRTRLRAYPDEEALTASEFTFDSPFVTGSPQLLNYGAKTLTPGVPLADAAIELSQRIHTDFVYAPKSTSIEMPLEEVFRRRRGVCQDFAHVMIGVLRSHGLAARYVSGYLRSGAKYTGAEASHAWVSVFIPEYGWLDLDPTNNVIPSNGHVTVAWGRDYGDVTPVKGVSLGGGEQVVTVEVRVVPEPDAS